MYVPATPLPAAPLAPVGIASADPSPTVPTPVHTDLRVHGYQLNVLADHRANVTGTLLGERRQGLPDQPVALQELGRHGWRTLARARTGTRGRFRLSFVPRRLGSDWVRLRFAGAGPELPAHRRLGRLNVYRLAMASWYGGGGSLPCGTEITLRYDGRTVRVPVVDRGPYVAGREFDLTEATKEALGFEGVGQVWSTS
jgi:rare lipoprotein A